MPVCFQRCYQFLAALLFGIGQLCAQTFTGISPNNGPPGTFVTITGTALSNITAVEFGLIQVPATPNGSGTSLTATLPSGPVPFETPGVVAITAIDSMQGPLATGLQFAITGNWTVVVTNILGGVGLGNAATIPVEGQSLPSSATTIKDPQSTFNVCNGVAIHPSGRTAYVVNSSTNIAGVSGTVSAIDLATNTVKGVVTVGVEPFNIAIDTLGTKAYVTNFRDGTISVLDISGANEQAPVLVGSVNSDSSAGSGPTGIAISYDNSTLYVINTGTLHLVSFSLSNPDVPAIGVVATIPGTFLPDAYLNVAVTPDNTKVYVSDIGLARDGTNVYSYVLPLQHGKGPNATITTLQKAPNGMAITRDGTRLYVACAFSSTTNQIGVIDIATDTLLSSISINTTTNLFDIIITPDDKFLYVTDVAPFPGLVWVIDNTDPANPKVLGSIQSGGGNPEVIAITPDPAPLAAFTATPTATPQTFQFDGSASISPVGTIASYAWNFGDGTMGTGESLTHTYANPGTYSVTLTVTNTAGTSTEIIFPTGQTVLNDGGPSATITQILTVCPPTPTLSGIDPTSGPAGTLVTLTGTNLTQIQQVLFGTIPGGIVSQSGASLMVIAPAGITPGTTVTVSVLDCSGTTSNELHFTYTNSCCPATPTITSISPRCGTAGTLVTITGTNLDSDPTSILWKYSRGDRQAKWYFLSRHCSLGILRGHLCDCECGGLQWDDCHRAQVPFPPLRLFLALI